MNPSLLERFDADVAIIGAGPAGTAAAIHLGRLGVGNIVIVDRDDFPRDKTCGSGISPKGLATLKALGVWEEILPHAYWIKGLRLVTPGGRELLLSGGDKTNALVCCRRTLDEILLKRAVLQGARFIPNFETHDLIYEDDRVAGFTSRDGRTVRAAYTVVANGARSRFAVDQSPQFAMQTIMGWWENLPFRPHHMEMILDRMVYPCYGWLFPESDTRVNIGICYEDPDHTKNGRKLFERFLDKHFAKRLIGAVQVGGWKGHPVSYCYRIGKLHSPGRLVVGEAGRMTHPATAEGIYQGMRSGMIAAEALRSALSPLGDERSISGYEKNCRRAFEASFMSATLWRRMLGTRVLDSVVGLCRRPIGRRALNKLMAHM